MLGLGIDDKGGDDEVCRVGDVVFIADAAFIARYGRRYRLELQDSLVTLLALDPPV